MIIYNNLMSNVYYPKNKLIKKVDKIEKIDKINNDKKG